MLYLCRVKPLRHYLRGFLIAAWAGDKIAEFSFPEISFHFSLRPWFFFVSPAYAGKSPAAAYACPGTQDHPRVCGEKLYTPCVIAPSVGSPPAYAGKRNCGRQSRCSTSDHPRVCGEKRGLILRITALQGSPPRMRGKVEVHCHTIFDVGITPAYAGKSRIRRACTDRHRDHPRVCGEKFWALVRAVMALGSPPHVRGKVHLTGAVVVGGGITPAYAGKSVTMVS